MINNIGITSNDYQNITPFPHWYKDNILDETYAKLVQQEILNIPLSMFDRYENPFEQKYTLRDKNAYPYFTQKLIDYLISDQFVCILSDLVGCQLFVDTTKNFYGIHMYKPGDKLDIHVDAGLHPTLNIRKQLTLGIYLSSDWKKEYGCALEIWDGEDASQPNPKLKECITQIHPMFNRLVLFTNTDNSWHGNPNPVAYDNPDARRIFITLSYLSNSDEYNNKKKKAYFVARPNDPVDENKDKLRLLRADPEQCKRVYNMNNKI